MKMLNKLVLSALVLLLTGCGPDGGGGVKVVDTNGIHTVYPDWKNAPTTHRCDEKQFVKVQTESDYCIARSAGNAEYCFNTAIVRNCVKQEVK